MRVVVVGAGLAGLAAANELARAGHEVKAFEADDGPGGRVRTDEVDGHLLDRGFQILLSGYPEARRLLDYRALDLKAFAPGALIRFQGGFHRIGDPIRDPGRLVETIRAPVGSPIDKARVVAFRRAVSSGTLDDLWERPETTARDRLDAAGFGAAMVERLLRPLFAGITLDPDLGGSSRVLEFVFRMLAEGEATVPAEGMGAIGAQMAARLPDGALRLSTPVERVEAGAVVLAGGERVQADQVIVATGMSDASALANTEDRGWRGVTSVWFSAPEAPIDEPVLALNGAGITPINSLAVMSRVSPTYAPPGRSTIVVSCPVVEPGLVEAMATELRSWFPASADWDLLRVDEIERAQPIHPAGRRRIGHLRTETGVLVCGDHLTDASINGALASGVAAARAVAGLPVG